MTHTRQMGDHEGDFGLWMPAEQRCPKCGSVAEYRTWESHDGAYEDYQYRCVVCPHRWWVDGIDS